MKFAVAALVSAIAVNAVPTRRAAAITDTDILNVRTPYPFGLQDIHLTFSLLVVCVDP